MEDLEDSDYAFIFLISALKELKIKVFSLFWKYCSLHNFSMFGRDRSLLLLIRSWESVRATAAHQIEKN